MPRWNFTPIFLGLALGASVSGTSVPAEDGRAPSPEERRALVERVIADQHANDAALDLYERIERRETRKGSGSSAPAQVQTARVIPAGAGSDRIPLGPDGKPADPAAYTAELRKLESALVWASEPASREQRDALAKFAKRRKDRAELVDAVRDAFIYTWLGREERQGRILAKFQLDPNPKYKPTSRLTGVFSHVRGVVWVDESAGQLARIEAEIAEDISFGGGLIAKVYKGGRFVMEQTEVTPGIWLPVFYDYNFDGRKFFFSMGVHERTTVSQYKRIGPPKEALAVIRAELGNLKLPEAAR
ncbi:MAG TPA: hypothetical protein VEU31_03050 [Candidatus Acidoferrales bacterium]|nr:hypothetical protein [Candidatus Acidoferrales bacterium]